MTAKGTKVIFGNLYYLKEFLNSFYEDIKKKNQILVQGHIFGVPSKNQTYYYWNVKPAYKPMHHKQVLSFLLVLHGLFNILNCVHSSKNYFLSG